ncbi:hypothetical protein EN860_033490, partial [Mesorhizobium sp. M00.F.Ca.ET.217.01.1.1]
SPMLLPPAPEACCVGGGVVFLRRPSQSFTHSGVESAGVKLVGTVAAIKAGRIKVAPDVKHFGERGATFVDGGQEEFDAVILATGYRPAYDNFLPAELRPQKSGVNARSSELGLYLVGFHNPVTGLL